MLTGPEGLTVQVDAEAGATLTGLRGPWDGDLLAPGLPVARAAGSGSPFVDSGLRGWVDCFPSIAPDRLDLGGGELQVADHGDLWFRRWEVEEVTGTAATLRCEVGDLGVLARKRAAWTGPGLRCRTEVTSRAAAPIPFVWAVHALFDLRPDDVLLLPTGTPETFCYRQFPAPAPYDEFWPPNAAGHRRWGDLPAGSMAKYFLAWPADGVRFTCHRRSLRLVWADVPPDAQLGLWINRHGFPVGEDAVGHLGIEPGLGWPDELSTAVGQGTAALLAPGETVAIDLLLEV